MSRRRRARRRPRRNPCQGRTNPAEEEGGSKEGIRFSRRKDREKKAKDPKPVADLPHFQLDSNNQQVVKWPLGDLSTSSSDMAGCSLS